MDADEIAKVLSEHVLTHSWNGFGGHTPATCSCSEVLSTGCWSNWTTEEANHRAHLAQVLARLIEQARQKGAREAWSQGHAAGREYQGDGWNQDMHDPEDDNPYAERAATPGSGTAGGGT